VSAEPLLGPLVLQGPSGGLAHNHLGDGGIDWVIVGGESGPHARPMHPDWARSLRDQCTDAGVPFFFKQLGEWLPVSSASYATNEGMRHGTNRVSMLHDGRIVLRDLGPSEKPLIVDKKADQDLVASWQSNEQLLDKHGCLPEDRKHLVQDLRYQWMARVGKKAAGRLLDGREWNEFPRVEVQ
jgi:protein gp37